MSARKDFSSSPTVAFEIPSSPQNDTRSGIQHAITATIEQFLKPIVVPNKKRKTMITRSSGESLTSVEALYKLQAKETERKEKKRKK
ncbi:unnamed protein product, partial [Didymodactylos carnosus]